MSLNFVRSLINLSKLTPFVSKTNFSTVNNMFKPSSFASSLTSTKSLLIKRLSSTQSTTQNEATTTTTTAETETKSEIPPDNETNQQKESPNAEKKVETEHPFAISKAFRIVNNTAWQPTIETHSSLLIEGVPYEKLHVISIKSSKNNTILTLSDSSGLIIHMTSSGICGFKNSKKSTAVAGQAAGLAMSEYMKRRNIKNVRVAVKGFGNGRLPAIKALQIGKINIVSITDTTSIPVAFQRPARPPVKRRV